MTEKKTRNNSKDSGVQIDLPRNSGKDSSVQIGLPRNSGKDSYKQIDSVRIIAALLVVAIHTSPLTSWSGSADFFLTRVLARVAVPFFFMVTGQFILADCMTDNGQSEKRTNRRIRHYIRKVSILYAVSILLYLPIGLYAGHYDNMTVGKAVKMLLFDGTFYHLWYFPACILGILLVYAMRCFMKTRGVLILSGVLYLIGLFGDSYFGLTEKIPIIAAAYEKGFRIWSYTRNGLFLAPVFLVLGAVIANFNTNFNMNFNTNFKGKTNTDANKGYAYIGLCASFALMTIEAFTLRYYKVQRHDSMYLMLIPVMVFGYGSLLSVCEPHRGEDGRKNDSNDGSLLSASEPHRGEDGKAQKYRIQPAALRQIATCVYIIYPAMIIVVRVIAKLTKVTIVSENSFINYICVVLLSFGAASFLTMFLIPLFICAVPCKCEKPYTEVFHMGDMSLKRRIGRAAGKEERTFPVRLGIIKITKNRNSRSNSKAIEQAKNTEQTKTMARTWIELDQKALARTRIELDQSAFARTWIELDQMALQNNVTFLKSKLPQNCRLMPAVKANAYGHGAVIIAKALCKMGVDAFCVASVQEGVELRNAGIKGEILVLGYTHPVQFDDLYQYRLSQTVIDYPYAEKLEKYGKTIHVHIGIDTGMHRLGERSENIEHICRIFAIKNLQIDGIFTHLSADDKVTEPHKTFTDNQAMEFYRVLDALKERGIKCPKIHLQASYGILNYPMLAGDYARVGIALYGVLSTAEDTLAWKEKLCPVLSCKTRVAAVKTIYAGEVAGYGLSFAAMHTMKIAVLAIGYADGLPRVLSNGKGGVLIHGKAAPVVGTICMDQTIVDVSTIPDVNQGDEVVVIGKSGNLEITVNDISAQSGTIANEILSRLGVRPERIIL